MGIGSRRERFAFLHSGIWFECSGVVEEGVSRALTVNGVLCMFVSVGGGGGEVKPMHCDVCVIQVKWCEAGWVKIRIKPFWG